MLQNPAMTEALQQLLPGGLMGQERPARQVQGSSRDLFRLVNALFSSSKVWKAVIPCVSGVAIVCHCPQLELATGFALCKMRFPGTFCAALALLRSL